MKKVIALIMCLVVVLSIAASAFAYSRKPQCELNRTVMSATTYLNGNAQGDYAIKDNTCDEWRASFNGPQPNKRVVARVFGHQSNGVVCSSTWVYSNKSYNWHPYKVAFCGESIPVHFGVKQDDRDNKQVKISGEFLAAR